MPSISDLSAELKLAIIESLDASDASDASNETLDDPSIVPFCPLPNQDLINLCCCCKTLRNLAAPKLFLRLRLQNTNKSGKSLLALADSTWADRVQELHFEGRSELEEDDPDDPTEGDLPAPVQEVLSHLERFPQLATLSVRFVFGDTPNEDYEAVANSFYVFDDYARFRDGDELRKLEKTVGWKDLMAKTYTAIARNEHGSPATLELLEVVPAGISPWTTEAWATFLGSVKKFKLSLYNYENGAGWCCNTSDSYVAFVENLDLLFEHLTSVTDFRLTTKGCGAPGVGGHHRAALPFNANHMPLLQNFELESCFISERLARLIASHSQTLKEIKLTDCFSGAGDSYADEQTTWEAFLTIVGNAIGSVEENVALEKLFISPANLCEKEYCAVSEGVEIEGSAEEVELVRRSLQDDPRRRMFAYGYMDDKYGYWGADKEHNLATFLAGQDQAAFDRLMAIIDCRV